ncbi:MAG TPA: NADH-quinone oxidoreductase subunit L [Vicinamibacterales bacterium]|nr:NADH-quinone oxidoreductase subunit L [Vicinamibacterales bacterium]
MTSHPVVLALWAWLLPAGAFLVLALAAPLRRSGRPAAYVSVLTALTALAASLAAWQGAATLTEPATLLWTWIPQHDGPLATVGVLADADSLVMLVLVALVACLVQVYSLGYLDHEEPAALGRYYLYQSLFAFSMMGLVLAPNFVQLFICWELVGLCSYLLIGFWYRKPAAARAAVKAFWTTKAGDVGLLIGIVLLWRQVGTFEFGAIRVMAEAGAVPLAGLSLITFCLYLGAAGKSAQFPLHVWLPDAMEGPTPVSALIHAATMVTAGVYLLVRTSWLFALTPDVLLIIGWVGAGTALMAAVLACVQTDIKRVLAYSTVSQLGYMMTAIGAGFAAAGFLHLLTHGVFKALLFLGAGAVIHAVGTNDITRMGGLARRMPQTMIVFLVGTLSLAGVPLFAGFLSKEEVLGATWAGGLTGPFVLLVVAAFLTAFYMFRVVFLTFFGAPATPAPATGSGAPGAVHAPHDAPAIMSGPLWLLAALSMVIGVLFTVTHRETPFDMPAWLMPLAVAVSAGGILLAWLTYQRRIVSADALAAAFGPIRRAALANFWVDAVFVAVYRVAFLSLARFIGWVDRYIVDGVLNVLSTWTVSAGDQLRRSQTGRVQDYVYGVALGAIVLVFWFRWLL